MSLETNAAALPLPVAADEHVDVELDVTLRTPLTLIVNARLELDADRSLDLALVIPRSQCLGERPRLAALLDAARAAIARATRGGTMQLVGLSRRVVTQVAGGRTHLIPV